MGNKIIVFGMSLCIMLLLSSCTQQPAVQDMQASSSPQSVGTHETTSDQSVSGIREINYTTDDGVTIFGTFYPGTTQDGVILVHMLGKDRSSWEKVPDVLNNAGFGVLAIDLRGHGKSVQGIGDFKGFTALDYQNMLYDIKGANDFLRKKGLSGSISIVGASIGANLALMYAAGDTHIQNIVLLSPGENYRGVGAYVANEQYRGRMLLVASENDIQSYPATSALSKRANGRHAFHSYGSAGHGTDMLKEPDLIPTIVDWLQNKGG